MKKKFKLTDLQSSLRIVMVPRARKTNNSCDLIECWALSSISTATFTEGATGICIHGEAHGAAQVVETTCQVVEYRFSAISVPSISWGSRLSLWAIEVHCEKRLHLVTGCWKSKCGTKPHPEDSGKVFQRNVAQTQNQRLRENVLAGI